MGSLLPVLAVKSHCRQSPFASHPYCHYPCCHRCQSGCLVMEAVWLHSSTALAVASCNLILRAGDDLVSVYWLCVSRGWMSAGSRASAAVGHGHPPCLLGRRTTAPVSRRYAPSPRPPVQQVVLRAAAGDAPGTPFAQLVAG